MESAINWLSQEIPAENLLRNSAVWPEVHPTLNDLESLLVISIHSKKKIWWIAECGHEWPAIIHHRAAKHNLACPFCTNVRLLSGVNDIVTRVPELLDEWDFEANGDPNSILFKPKHKFSWIGKNCGHKWPARLDHRMRGDGCPVCSGSLIIPGENDMATKHPSLARNIAKANPSINPTTLALWSYLKVTLNCDKCKKDFEDKIRKHSDKPGVFCPACRKSASGLELVVGSRLEDLDIDFVHNSKPITYLDSEGVKRRFEIDFLLPEYSLGFEIQDFSTHSKDRDDEPTERNWGSDGVSFKRGPTYHELKRRLAKEQLNITLIDIWQDDLWEGRWERHLKDFWRA